MNYKLVPHLFGRPGETVTAVIRHYNSLELDKEIVRKLVNIFEEENKDNLPPKLSKKYNIPVLEQYWYKHENKIK